MTLVVNLIGGPGAGKSTCAAATFAQLKYRGYTPELALEWVKEAVWEGRDSIVSNQLYIFAKQHKRIHDTMGKVDAVITDSPLLLSVYYGGGRSPELDALVLSEISRMDNLNVLLHREKAYDPRGRWQTEEEAKGIDVALKQIMDENRIPYVELPGNELTPGVLADMIAKRLEGDEMHEDL